MDKKLKKARLDLINSAKALDKISKCRQAKQKIMTIAVKAWLKEFYKY
ncbi:MAG: hypothetical protein WC312_03195 [Candidatus Omnitrophota bacterium]|jgi:hypothetical protein